MYIDAAKLEDEVAKHLMRFNYDLVDFQVIHVAHNITYRVFIDRLDLAPLTLGDCERISLPLKLFLTTLGVYDDRAQLEVSSPGLDRILKRDSDFGRFRGNRLRVRYRTNGSKKTIIGILTDYSPEYLIVETAGGAVVDVQKVPRCDLIEARLVSEV